MNDDEKLRAFLLGQLPEADQHEIARQFIATVTNAEALEMAEDELIDAYLDGRLLPSELRQFEQYFLVSEERRKRLGFAKALRYWLLLRKSSRWSRFRRPRW